MSVLASVLPQVKAFSEGEMMDTVVIHRSGTATSNEYGAMVPGADADIRTTGRISALDARDVEGIVSGELRMDGLEKLSVPLSTSVGDSDTVTVTSARHGTTRDYTVEGVLPLGTFSVHRKVLVRKV